ncbi:very-long-chain (3R)-3-hydroxyacyl-CoA dehydratase hpo-8 [Hylaeus volcanicus]|uniref:very-long-chain (3R)-3-hydroxyacyl-CoA dehydratase hpo-8 n=1 Tax=Hylaeus volcanicus TaxID=313075 RepID=UPI0023B83C85|nr:very-long-chain (3R)-3-hydroxyacyl-CoA dehydratase hpo-8 [Hylaeus volcanicus]
MPELINKNMKSKKSKKSGSSGIIYLKIYNFAQVLGWCYILYKFLQSDFSSPTRATLWQNVKWPVVIFQHAAFLEVVHAALGLVKSNPILTAFQILSRVVVVSFVLLATPENYAASSFGLPLALSAWSITEIIRYLYYLTNLIEFVPYLLTWLRYTLFIGLYPIGVTGELLCIYSGVQYGLKHPQAFDYVFPSSWNYAYYYLTIIIMLSYIPCFPMLYLHMFGQRRKILGGSTHKKSQ